MRTSLAILSLTLTSEQRDADDNILDFIDNQVFVVHGLAGVGQSHLLAHVANVDALVRASTCVLVMRRP